MTYENQDITDHFYSGNSKTVLVKIDDQDGNLKDLTGAELTYVIMDRKDYSDIKLRKSSANGDSEIKVISLGYCEIYLKPADTINLYGKFRHHLNVVDADGEEETVFTGLVEIHRTFAQRYRIESAQAFLEGATT